MFVAQHLTSLTHVYKIKYRLTSMHLYFADQHMTNFRGLYLLA